MHWLLVVGLLTVNIAVISGNKCPSPQPISHGQYQFLNSANWPKSICRIQYQCDVGFNPINGSSGIMYCFRSRWIGQMPVCQEISCRPLDAPANGTIAVIETGAPTNGMDSIVEFRCNVGYELVGDLSLVCLDNGEWSGEVPYCLADPDCEVDVPTAAGPEPTTAVATTVAETTTPRVCDGGEMLFNGLCYFMTDQSTKNNNADRECNSVHTGATAAEIRNKEINTAVQNFFRGRTEHAWGEDFHVAGRYDYNSNIITWSNGEETSGDDVQWKDNMPETTNKPENNRLHIKIRKISSNPKDMTDVGLWNVPDDWNYRVICQH